MGEHSHYCSSAVDDLLVGKPSNCNDLQVQGLGNKAKNSTFKAKDLKIVLKESLSPRPRIPITAPHPLSVHSTKTSKMLTFA